MEFCQEFIDRRVGNVDLVKVVILPEFLGIAQFYIGESVLQVIFQGATIDQGILGEVVGAGAIAPVHVGHDNQLHSGVEGKVLDALKEGKVHLCSPVRKRGKNARGARSHGQVLIEPPRIRLDIFYFEHGIEGVPDDPAMAGINHHRH